MTEADLALVSLVLAFLVSNAFWAWNTHKLMNKLMSRNYQEFKVADVTTDKPKDRIVKDFGAIDDMASLSEFN